MTQSAIPAPVLRAIEHVRSFYPRVCMVAFNDMGRWKFMDEDFNAPVFDKSKGPTPDVAILEAAAEHVRASCDLPAVFQLHPSSDNGNPHWIQSVNRKLITDLLLEATAWACTAVQTRKDVGFGEDTSKLSREEAETIRSTLMKSYITGLVDGLIGIAMFARYGGDEPASDDQDGEMREEDLQGVVGKLGRRLLLDVACGKVITDPPAQAVTAFVDVLVRWAFDELTLVSATAARQVVVKDDSGALTIPEWFLLSLVQEHLVFPCSTCKDVHPVFHLSAQARDSGITIASLRARWEAEGRSKFN